MTKSFLAVWDRSTKCFKASFSPPIFFSGDSSWRLSLRRSYIKCEATESLVGLLGLVVLWPFALVTESVEKRIFGDTQLPIIDIILYDTTVDAGTSFVYSPSTFQNALYTGVSNLESICFYLDPLFSKDLPEIIKFTSLIKSGFIEIIYSNEHYRHI